MCQHISDVKCRQNISLLILSPLIFTSVSLQTTNVLIVMSCYWKEIHLIGLFITELEEFPDDDGSAGQMLKPLCEVSVWLTFLTISVIATDKQTRIT